MLGLYYITLERDGEPGEGMLFAEIGEIEHALHSQHDHAARQDQGALRGRTTTRASSVTPRRRDHAGPHAAVARSCRKHPNLPFSLINRLLTKKDLQNVIDMVYRHCGQKETVIFADRLMGLGFYHACRAGISFGKDDLVIPAAKDKLVATTTEGSEGVRAAVPGRPDHLGREIQQGGRRLVALHRSRRRGDDEGHFRRRKPGKPVNSVCMMAHSGARGSAAQMKQLAGMRGLMAKPSGEIIETPIISNFKEGLIGARVLQLDPRRAQGPGRHRAQDRQLGLPDPPSGRRGAGLHHHRGGLRHRHAASRCARSSTAAT